MKRYNNQLFTIDNGEEFLIDVVVDLVNKEVADIYASEDINYKI